MAKRQAEWVQEMSQKDQKINELTGRLAEALAEKDRAQRDLREVDQRLIPLEHRVEDLIVVQENRMAQNQALGVYHAIMAGKVPLDGRSLLLMHLIAENPKEFVAAAKRAGLGSFFLNLTSDLEERVLVELRSGRKIPAIKLYREATHLGLKEAKDAVEAIGERNGIPRPNPIQY